MERSVVEVAALDDKTVRARLDPTGMLARIEGLPDQFQEGWEQAASFELPVEASGIVSLVVLGMGGSAMAGDIVRSLAMEDGGKPITVIRGYQVPRNVDSRCLVVACSHSGNTEETLAAFEQARERGLRTVVITTGGELLERALRDVLPLFTYAFDGEPRSALGLQLAALMRAAEQAGALSPQESSAQEAVTLMRAQRERMTGAVAGDDNVAKQLAARLVGRVPIVIGGGMLAEAAHRWKTQFNENSKSWAFDDELPELDHNSVVGFGLPRSAVEAIHVVFLRQAELLERDRRRYEATADELSLAGVSHESIESEGKSALGQVMAALYMGDFVSYYLALLYGVDPSPVPPIVRLKERLGG